MVEWIERTTASEATSPAPGSSPPGNAKKDGPRAGFGLPSRKLHYILGAAALVGAIIIGLKGTPAPKKAAETPAPAPKAQTIGTAPPKNAMSNELRDQERRAEKSRRRHAVGSFLLNGSRHGRSRGVMGDLSPAAAESAASAGQTAASPILAFNQTHVVRALSGAEGQGSGSGLAPQGLMPPDMLAGTSGSQEASLLKSLSGAMGNKGAAELQTSQTEQDSESKFLSDHGKSRDYGDITSVLPKLKGAALYPGAAIPAVTITRVDTQLPGMIVAQVTRNVYSRAGRLVVPAGARVIGQYDSQVFEGQYRVLMAFSRVIFPDGREVRLGNSEGVGGRGAAGVPGAAHTHFFKILGASLLVAMLDTGVSDMGPSQQIASQTGTTQSSPSQTAAQAFAQTGKQILQPYTSMPPTVTIPAGTAFSILVNRTVMMPDAKGD